MSIFLQNTNNQVKFFGEYKTLQNGGRPFLVKIFVDGENVFVKIFKGEGAWEDSDGEIHMNYDKLIKRYDNITGIFIPDHVEDGQIEEEFAGNSILINLRGNHYVEVGECVYEFTTPEPIEKYSSIVGPSAIPYPVAYSKNYLYFMHHPLLRVQDHDENSPGEMVRRDLFKKISYNSADMYSIYFNKFESKFLSERIAQGLKPFQNINMIAKRTIYYTTIDP